MKELVRYNNVKLFIYFFIHLCILHLCIPSLCFCLIFFIFSLYSEFFCLTPVLFLWLAEAFYFPIDWSFNPPLFLFFFPLSLAFPFKVKAHICLHLVKEVYVVQKGVTHFLILWCSKNFFITLLQVLFKKWTFGYKKDNIPFF